MTSLPHIELDKRVLKEDYCNYDLIARCWDDEYRGRVWKNKQRIADCEGGDLDEIMAALRAIVDDIQAEKRRKRGRKKPTTREMADAILSIEPKLSRTQKMMLVIHSKSPGHRISLRALCRVGDHASPEAAFANYAEIGRRLGDELGHLPRLRRKNHDPGMALLIEEEIPADSLSADAILTLREEIVKPLELIRW